MAETALARRGDALLRRRGAYWINVHGTVAGDTGTPDRIACYRGIFLAIEWKRPGARLTYRASAKQRWHVGRIQAAGGIAIVADDLEHLCAVLDRIDDATAASTEGHAP
jgi:hypothetical protein